MAVAGSIPRYGCTSLFKHSPIEGHLDYFQFWVITSKAALNNCVVFKTDFSLINSLVSPYINNLA